MTSYTLTHLKQLEAESIHIIREVAAEFQNPVLLYSGGKDSACLTHLARKAFYPGRVPFPLLHIATTWDFRELLEFRDQYCRDCDLPLSVYTNEEALATGVNPFDYATPQYSAHMQTQALVQALKKGKHDAAFGGARRDEEKARAKERVYSFRDRAMQWDPKNQRPELWNLYNGRLGAGESIRVFPLSNWTELDVWEYIRAESIPLPPLYFAKERPCVDRGGQWIVVDDDRMRLEPGERPVMRVVRFRTLGDYPLTGAIESTATTVADIIQETLLERRSERQGRLIDHDEAGSMEQKKREGYF
ncbi:MAG TPA: sulfate adenylyltransferase subunit CysD [Tepidisphaeraceae bacterium]|jgi:sulfate adenylyltransferase subunit 2|nr:sulfate adenylyltransferase subunit CysD [Tepidisphaeraceae bacterium]